MPFQLNLDIQSIQFSWTKGNLFLVYDRNGLAIG